MALCAKKHDGPNPQIPKETGLRRSPETIYGRICCTCCAMRWCLERKRTMEKMLDDGFRWRCQRCPCFVDIPWRDHVKIIDMDYVKIDDEWFDLDCCGCGRKRSMHPVYYGIRMFPNIVNEDKERELKIEGALRDE